MRAETYRTSSLIKKETDMPVQHVSFRLKGFYKIASLSTKWEAIMGTVAQQKLEALTFWNKHGLNVTFDAL